MDEAFITICSLISPDLLFHISSCKTPNESWTTLEGLFGKHNEMRGHILDVELLTLDPKIFDNIKYFFTKFKDLLSQLKACGVDKYKEEKQMVLTILSKLGPEFFVFMSTFHSVRFTSGATWKMPSLEDFIESLFLLFQLKIKRFLHIFFLIMAATFNYLQIRMIMLASSESWKIIVPLSYNRHWMWKTDYI